MRYKALVVRNENNPKSYLNILYFIPGILKEKQYFLNLLNNVN